MPSLFLKISITEHRVTKLLHFDKSMTVFDACRHIKAKCGASQQIQAEKSHGLFLPSEDTVKGIWLENGRDLNSYHFKSVTTLLEYRSKQRSLCVHTLDGATRRVIVDDSLPAYENVRAVCARIGIQNPQEFSFTVDKKMHQSTLQRTTKPSADRKLDTLRKEKHTHDFLSWVDPSKTLREQGLFQDSVEVTFRKKYFFSDKELEANDPVQLHLLYTQTCKAVTDGVIPVTLAEAVILLALQCQEMFGDFVEKKFPKGSLRTIIRGLLPSEYRKDTKKMLDNLIQEYQKLAGLTELLSKFYYIERCRKLDTYGTSFFAVKEKVPRRNQLRPVLLGVKRECVITLDVKTKEVLEMWELKMIYSYFFTPTSFCLNFGEYRGLYIVKTTEGESIVQLLDGYIELIQQEIRTQTASPPSPVMEQLEICPKERMKCVISDTVGKLSQHLAKMEDTFLKVKIKKSKLMTIETSKLQLSSIVSGLLHSSALIWREVMMGSGDVVLISAAACSFDPLILSLTHCSKTLASLGLTVKDSVRILGSTKALTEACIRLLQLLQDNQVHNHLQVTLEDISSRSVDLLALVDLKKGKAYATYQSVLPLLVTVTESVSNLLAQARKINENCEEIHMENDIFPHIKEVELALQVLTCMHTIVSSCSDSPTGQSFLIEMTQILVEAVHRLCLTAKDACLDVRLLTEIGASACTVTSNLNALISILNLTPRKHPLEQSFFDVTAEAAILKSFLKRRQTKKRLLAQAKIFVLRVKESINSLKLYLASEKLEQEKDMLKLVRRLLDELRVFSESLKDPPSPLESNLDHLEVAMSTLSSVLVSYLDRIRDSQLSIAVRTASDSFFMFIIFVRSAVELSNSGMKGQLLLHCEEVEGQLKKLQTAQVTMSDSESPNHHSVWVVAREFFHQISIALSLSEALKADLQPEHEHISVGISCWGSFSQSHLHELKSLLSKTRACSKESMEICLKSMKALKESLCQPTEATHSDKVLLSSYQSCHNLMELCTTFLSLASQVESFSDKLYIYYHLLTLVERCAESILEMRQLDNFESTVQLTGQLLDQMGELCRELSIQSVPGGTSNIAIQSDVMIQLRDSLPLQQEFVGAIQTLEESLENTESSCLESTLPFKEELSKHLHSITFVLLDFLKLPEKPLHKCRTIVRALTTSVQSLLLFGRQKATTQMPRKNVELLVKLKRFGRSVCRLIQAGRTTCYQETTHSSLVTPTMKCAIRALYDCALALQSEEGYHTTDISILELEVVLKTLATSSVLYPTKSYSQFLGELEDQAKVFEEFADEQKSVADVIQTVCEIAYLAKHAASLTPQLASKEVSLYPHQSHLSRSQLDMWSVQFLNDCELLLDMSLPKQKVSALLITLSMEIKSMYQSIGFMAKTLISSNQGRVLLESMKSLSGRASQFIQEIQALNGDEVEKDLSQCNIVFEQLLNGVNSLVCVYITTHVFEPKVVNKPNAPIMEAVSSLLTSAKSWCEEDRGSVDTQIMDMAILRKHVKTLVTTVKDSYNEKRRWLECLRQIGSLKEQLESSVSHSRQFAENREVSDSSSLYFSVKKTGKLCHLILKKLLSIHSQPRLDCVAHQTCSVARDVETLVATVIETSLLSPKCDSSLRLVEHTTTCLEALSDILVSIINTASDQAEGDVLESVRNKVERLAGDLEDLVLLTLTISREGFVTANVIELSRVVDKDEIPPFVLEDVDNGLAAYTMLTQQCHSLTKVIDSVDSSSNTHLLPNSSDRRELSGPHHTVIVIYREITKLILTISSQMIEKDEEDALCDSVQSLGESLVSVLLANHTLNLHPGSSESKMMLKESVYSVHKELSQLVLLSQVTEEGSKFSVINNLKSCITTIDSLWICAVYGQQRNLSTDETDSQTKNFSSNNILVLLGAINNLVKVSEETPRKASAAVFLAANALPPLYESLEKGYASYSNDVLTALRDITTILVELMVAPTAHMYSRTIISSAKLAQQAAAYLLRDSVEHTRRQKLDSVDTVSTTIAHMDHLLTAKLTQSERHAAVPATSSDMMYLSTLLSFLSKHLKEGIECDRIDDILVIESTMLVRLTFTYILEVYSRLNLMLPESAELRQSLFVCTESIKLLLEQVKANLLDSNKVNKEAATNALDSISSFSQELLEVSKDVYDDTSNWDIINEYSLLHTLTMSRAADPHSNKNPIVVEDVDSPHSGEGDNEVISVACSALSQALHNLSSRSNLASDKEIWIQSHMQMVLDMSEGEKKNYNSTYFLKVLLKIAANVFVLWKDLDIPGGNDWLALMATSRDLIQAIAANSDGAENP